MASENSYPKQLEDLLSHLPDQESESLKCALLRLGPVHLAVMRCKLAHLPDRKWEDLIIRLTDALPWRLHRYANILGAFDPGRAVRCRNISDDAPTREEPTYSAGELSADDLRAGLKSLPTEIYNEITSAFIKCSIAPVFIFPDQPPSPNGMHLFKGRYYHPFKYDILLGLNRINYAYHGPRFWNSFFVVGPGSESYTMDWLRRMDDRVQKKVWNVYIALDRQDLKSPPGTNAEYMAEKCVSEGADYDPLELMDDFDEEVLRLNAQLDHTWWLKMDRLTGLKLKTLVIDVMHAYGADDSFLGDEFMRLVPKFGRRRPESVGIVAGDEETAERILKAFRVRNP